MKVNYFFKVTKLGLEKIIFEFINLDRQKEVLFEIKNHWKTLPMPMYFVLHYKINQKIRNSNIFKENQILLKSIWNRKSFFKTHTD